MLHSLVFPRAKPHVWTLSIACCLRSPGRRWKMQAWSQRNSAKKSLAFSSVSSRVITGIGSSAIPPISMCMPRQGALALVAVHLACQSLRTGSCTVALAGGVNVLLNPDHTIGFSQGRMMAPDGHCKTFDAQADGYVRSEGAGVVVLKPLSLALANGD